jgi:ABC-2 type transport system ATP-binding protein
MPAIEVVGLVVAYGPKLAVDGLDLRVERGEVVALLGRNGAGKTTTVETLEGYRRSASGTVRVLGLDPARPADHRELARRVGVMLQKGGIYPAMGPKDALELFSRYYDQPAPPSDLLRRLGLEGVAGTPWRRLSGGEQQRLSLALALVGNPELVFLDEPTAGVDPGGRLDIRAEIARLRQSGVTVLLTSHEMEEAERVADRIVIIDRGRVVASGTAAALTSGGSQTYFEAEAGIDVAALGAALGAVVAEAAKGEYVVACPPSPALTAALTAWLAERNIHLTGLRAGKERLEDVFLRVTGCVPERSRGGTGGERG